MKKLTLFFFSFCMLIAISGFSTLYAFCINGKAIFVITDGNGNVLQTFTNGNCLPDGFMWKANSLVVSVDATGEDGMPATAEVYSALNGINTVTDTTSTVPLDTVMKYKSAINPKYYLDPFLLNQDIAEELAKADGLNIYGLKIMGNPFSGHDVNCKVLSTVFQTVQIKVTGASFTYTTNVTLNKGLNTLSVNVPNSVSGPAYFKVGASNTAKTVINFL